MFSIWSCDGRNFSAVNPLLTIREGRPKQKKRVHRSVPGEQRVNALCIEKNVLHNFQLEVENRVAQVILRLHRFTGKRLLILAENWKRKP